MLLQYGTFTKYSLFILNSTLYNGGNTYVSKKALQNKKGFTLVELMIVVVIMGILVAVAIPVYNVVTNHAEESACHSNCEIVEKAAVQYYMNAAQAATAITGGANSVTVSSSEDAKTELPAEFLACFNDGKFPECPHDGCTYTIYPSTSNNQMTIDVYCSEHGDKNGEMPT